METALALLRRQGLLEEWSDRCILPGKSISTEIAREIAEADIFVFLLSPDFLASDECMKEWNLVTDIKNKGKPIFQIPVVIRICPWRNLLEIYGDDIKVLPHDGKAVLTYQDKDLAWNEVYEGIKSVINELKKSRQIREDQYQDPLSNFEEELPTYRESSDRPLEAKSLFNIGVSCFGLEDYPRALNSLEQALAIYQEIGDRPLEAKSLLNIGDSYKNFEEYRKALDSYQQALAIYQEIGDRPLEAKSLLNIGDSYKNLGKYHKALDSYQQALAIYKEIDDSEGEVISVFQAVRIEMNDENDENSRQAKLFSTKPVYDPDSLSIWKPGMIRLFISHADKYKDQANELATALERYGISSFIGHDTIQPLTTWQEEIIKGLKTMEIMLAFITDDFHESIWTNQEVGFALGRNIPVLSMKLQGADPHGFIGSYKVLTGCLDHPEKPGPEVYKLLAEKLGQEDRLQTALIAAFLFSRSFPDTMSRFNCMNKTVDRLSDDQVKQIIRRFTENDQLYKSTYLISKHKRLQKFLRRTTGKSYVVEKGKIFIKTE